MIKKRYNLGLPVDLFDRLEEIAETKQSTTLAILQRFIEIGLLLHESTQDGGKLLIERDGETTKELIIL